MIEPQSRTMERLFTRLAMSHLILFILGLSCVESVLDQHDKDCVEIHRWEEVEYQEDTQEVCTYECSKSCDIHTEEVCIPTPVTTCELFGYRDCTEERQLREVRSDHIQEEEFPVTTCRPGDKMDIIETKQVPVCEDRVKEKCDSKWDIKPDTGDKVQTGWVNCREVTWQECTMEDTLVVSQVETNNCTVTNYIAFHHMEEKYVTISIITTKVGIIFSFFSCNIETNPYN